MRIKIGEVVWKVNETSHIDDFGVTEYMAGEILLNSSQTTSQMRETLLHEVCHAIVFSYGIQLGTPEQEEQFINSFSPVLLSVICNNPEFLSILVGEMKMI